MSHKAIRALYPQVVSIDGEMPDAIAFDIDGNEVEYDLSEVQAWVAPDTYKLLRHQEYPSIKDQLDILYHEGYDGWKAQIQAVKDKYPKA